MLQRRRYLARLVAILLVVPVLLSAGCVRQPQVVVVTHEVPVTVTTQAATLTPEVSPTVNISTDWKTYESIDGSFSVEIPNSWEIWEQKKRERLEFVLLEHWDVLCIIGMLEGGASVFGTKEENIQEMVAVAEEHADDEGWSGLRILNKGEWEGVNPVYYCEYLLFRHESPEEKYPVITFESQLVISQDLFRVSYAVSEQTEMTQEDYATIRKIVNSIQVHK